MQKLKRPKRNKIYRVVGKFILKATAVCLMISLNGSGLFAMGTALAFYLDGESSPANLYQAGVLDFYLSSPSENFIPSFTVTDMKPGDSVTRSISVIQNGNPFLYNIETVKTGGSDDFCNALKLEAEREGEEKYSDGLMNLNLVPPVQIGEDGQDDWVFTATLPSDTSFEPGLVCQIKFVFLGWQTVFPDPSLGFTDQEEIESSFGTGGMKINKVYYDVAPDKGSEIINEWIEIYNPLNTPIDISGWTIKDNSGSDVLPSMDPVPGKGFALILADGGTLDYWDVPSSVVVGVLPDGSIGDGLDNDSDRVILEMPSGLEDDAMSYGADTYAFDPTCPDVAEGHALARIPVGQDTNQASDWQDIGMPEVEVIYPNGGEVWYVGRTYTILWSATNTNGLDSDLSIGIWYSGNSGGDWANIVKDTENDGAFDWRVPLFLDGYYTVSDRARIRVVATGPENFMAQDQDMSDEDFCPPIDYEKLTPEEVELLEKLLETGEIFLYTFDNKQEAGEPVEETKEETKEEVTEETEETEEMPPENEESEEDTEEPEPQPQDDPTEEGVSDETGTTSEGMIEDDATEESFSDNQEETTSTEQIIEETEDESQASSTQEDQATSTPQATEESTSTESVTGETEEKDKEVPPDNEGPADEEVVEEEVSEDTGGETTPETLPEEDNQEPQEEPEEETSQEETAPVENSESQETEESVEVIIQEPADLPGGKESEEETVEESSEGSGGETSDNQEEDSEAEASSEDTLAEENINEEI